MLKFVSLSAAEANLVVLFINVKETLIVRLALSKLGNTQPSTPIHCDNSTATDIANGTVKNQWSRSMEMRYFCVCNQVKHSVVDVLWNIGQDKLGYYTSKHHDTPRHKSVRPYFLHERNSQRILPQASKLSSLQGCVGNIPGGYVWGRTIPVIHRSRARIGPSSTGNIGSTRKPLEQ